MKRLDVLAVASALAALALPGCDAEKTAPPAGSIAQAAVAETWNVSGMTCTGCEKAIKSEVAKLEGVSEVKADHQAGSATVTFDPGRTDRAAIKAAIEKAGYKVEG